LPLLLSTNCEPLPLVSVYVVFPQIGHKLPNSNQRQRQLNVLAHENPERSVTLKMICALSTRMTGHILFVTYAVVLAQINTELLVEHIYHR
jgi:hypothetical protein